MSHISKLTEATRVSAKPFASCRNHTQVYSDILEPNSNPLELTLTFAKFKKGGVLELILEFG